MIHTPAITRATLPSPFATAPGGDAAAFGVSLAALIDTPGQPVAAPGKPLPSVLTPVAPVSADPGVLDTGVAPPVPAPAAIVPAQFVPASPRPAAIVDAAQFDRLDAPVPIAPALPKLVPTAPGRPAASIDSASAVTGHGAGTAAPLSPDSAISKRPVSPERPGLQDVEGIAADAVDAPRPAVSPAAATNVEGRSDGLDVLPEQIAQVPIARSPRPAPATTMAASSVREALLPDDGETAAPATDALRSEDSTPDDTPVADVATPSAPPVLLVASALPEAQVVVSAGIPQSLPIRGAPAPSQLGPGIPLHRSTSAPADRAARPTVPASERDSGQASPSTAADTAVGMEPRDATAESPAWLMSQTYRASGTDTGPAAPPAPARPEVTVASASAAVAMAPAVQVPPPAPDAPADIVQDRRDDARAFRPDQPAAPRTVEISQTAAAPSTATAPVAAPEPVLPGDAPAHVPVKSAPIAGADSFIADPATEPKTRRVSNAIAQPSPTILAAPVEPRTPTREIGSPDLRVASGTTSQAAPRPSQPTAAALPLVAAPTTADAATVRAVAAPSDAVLAGSRPACLAEPAQPNAAPERARSETLGMIALPTAAAPAIVAGATAPAFRLFAQAIHAARRDDASNDHLIPAFGLATGAIDPMRALQPAGASGASLDMTGHRWPQAMVDRIEALRDAASAANDAANTSIRLVPASLGTIDVSVRRDGDTVHVHFNAELAATRTLLTEAQPRLAELAESRGLKLGQASVGAGTDQNAQRQLAQQPARIAAAPAPTAHDDETDIALTRVA